MEGQHGFNYFLLTVNGLGAIFCITGKVDLLGGDRIPWFAGILVIALIFRLLQRVLYGFPLVFQEKAIGSGMEELN